MSYLLPAGHPYQLKAPSIVQASPAPLRALNFFPDRVITQDAVNFFSKHMAGGPNNARDVVWTGGTYTVVEGVTFNLPSGMQRFVWSSSEPVTFKRADNLLKPPVARNVSGQLITDTGGLCSFQPAMTVRVGHVLSQFIIDGDFILDGNYTNQIQVEDIVFDYGSEQERRSTFEQSHDLAISVLANGRVGLFSNLNDPQAKSYIKGLRLRDPVADSLKLGAGGGQPQSLFLEVSDIVCEPRQSDVRAHIAVGGVFSGFIHTVSTDSGSYARPSRIESETEQTPTTPQYIYMGKKPDGTSAGVGNVAIQQLEIGGGANTEIRDSLIYELTDVHVTQRTNAGRCTLVIKSGDYHSGSLADWNGSATAANFRMANVTIEGGVMRAGEDRGWSFQWGVAGLEFEGGTVTIADGVTFPIDGSQAQYPGPVLRLNSVQESVKDAVWFQATNLSIDARVVDAVNPVPGFDQSQFPQDRVLLD
jgi:hypothetical protein